MALVYIHVNKVTNQKYVGITNYTDAEKRWRDGKGYETQYFGKAGVAVYGWDGFIHTVLVNGIAEKVAATLECLLIREMELTNPKYGYNTSEGKIYSDSLTEAKEIMKEIMQKDPFILSRSRGELTKFSPPKNVVLDPVVIKTVKVGVEVSRLALGSITDYFNNDYIYYSFLVLEKSNTSFLLILEKKFAFIDKGEIYVYPYDNSQIQAKYDGYDHKADDWKYKTVEVGDSNGIKPTLVITGTIANMRAFAPEVFRIRRKYWDDIEAEKQRKIKAIQDEQMRKEREKREKEQKEAQRLYLLEQEKIREAKIAARRARWRKFLDFFKK